MDRRGYLAGSGSLLAALTAGCSGLIPEQAESTPAPDSDEWTPKPSVEGSMAPGSDSTLVVTQHGFAIAGDHARVRGQVENTDEDPQPVTVTVELFGDGADGPAAEEGEAERDELPAGERWTFAVVFGNVAAPEITEYTVRTD